MASFRGQALLGDELPIARSSRKTRFRLSPIVRSGRTLNAAPQYLPTTACDYATLVTSTEFLGPCCAAFLRGSLGRSLQLSTRRETRMCPVDVFDLGDFRERFRYLLA